MNINKEYHRGTTIRSYFKLVIYVCCQLPPILLHVTHRLVCSVSPHHNRLVVWAALRGLRPAGAGAVLGAHRPHRPHGAAGGDLVLLLHPVRQRPVQRLHHLVDTVHVHEETSLVDEHLPETSRELVVVAPLLEVDPPDGEPLLPLQQPVVSVELAQLVTELHLHLGVLILVLETKLNNEEENIHLQAMQYSPLVV